MAFKSTMDGLYERISEEPSRRIWPLPQLANRNMRDSSCSSHLICSGFSRSETEYALIDLSFLDIKSLLLLRGDKAKHENRFCCQQKMVILRKWAWGNQVNNFNNGLFLDGTKMDIMLNNKFFLWRGWISRKTWWSSQLGYRPSMAKE